MEAKRFCFNYSASQVMSLAKQKRKAADMEDGRKVVVSAADPWVDTGPQAPDGISLARQGLSPA